MVLRGHCVRSIIRLGLAAVCAALFATGAGARALPAAQAADLVPIYGAGSTWASDAVQQWSANVRQFGLPVNYQDSGSLDGRRQFANGTVDFGVSELPYSADEKPARPLTYVPLTGGATALMYNLRIGGQQVTNLRLTGDLVARIFTGDVTSWDDPAIAARNPGLQLPRTPITPVVRADDNGTSAHFTSWLAHVAHQRWKDYCAAAGRSNTCDATPVYPVAPGMNLTTQSGSLGVSGYVSQASSDGAITYVENSYARNLGFPAAKILNAAGYYAGPTASAASIALLDANADLDPSAAGYPGSVLGGSYTSKDARAYPISNFSYLIAPTTTDASFTAAKGASLAQFGRYALCDGQRQARDLGYVPLPVNVVRAGLTRLASIPGADPATASLAGCTNPTIGADGRDVLRATAPSPLTCDRAGPAQCGVPGVSSPQREPAIQYPAGATATRYTGAAFSVCALPSSRSLTAWKDSPYRAVGVQIGGPNRSCTTAAPAASWVSGATNLGWRILPVYAGRQAPCATGTGLKIDPSTAATAIHQGTVSAHDAVAVAGKLGLRPGSILYVSMPGYDRGNTTCRLAVLNYLAAFTLGLHEGGYLSGVQAELSSAIRDLAQVYGPAKVGNPDALWITGATSVTSLNGLTRLPDESWSAHQRVVQPGLEHVETRGGVALTITGQIADAPAATVAHRFLSTAPTMARKGPSSTSPPGTRRAAGARLAVICQTPGQKAGGTKVWDQLADGQYLSDSVVMTTTQPGYHPDLPRCSYPDHVSAADAATVRSGADSDHPARGVLFTGALAWVSCQAPGSAEGGTKVWNKLVTGGYVSDHDLSSPSSPGYSPPIPRC